MKLLASLLFHYFATDQTSHAQHLPDGKYRRKYGAVTKKLLEKMLLNSGSLAIYQKNSDLSIKWICFDFDILKANIVGDKRTLADIELTKTVKTFCNTLSNLNIPYLLEFSGNRGFHVWITFTEKTSYRTGYEIQQTILDHAQLHYNKELIGIDLFPKTGTPTDGTGLGVKVPLSKHTKSKNYATLLGSLEEIESLCRTSKIDNQTLLKNVEILQAHRSTNKSELEAILGSFFNVTHDETFRPARIKSIEVQNNSFTLTALIQHWKFQPPLHALAQKIETNCILNHEERKLLVGMLCNISAKNIENAGFKLLIEIFRRSENYNPAITIRSIRKLSSFNFPSQEQIENTTTLKFLTTLTTEELVYTCIPTCRGFKDATFDIAKSDIEITKAAELNYLFLNDEAQSKIVINELSSIDNLRTLELAQNIIKHPKQAQFYKHIRNEPKKTRTLVTLKANERVATSCILKQLIYFLNIQPSLNSHGYRPNKGFSEGYIFQPWLYLWIKFVSNISNAIEDPDNQHYYIIKTDIKSFYDSIPHDNIKRMLLGGVNRRIDIKLDELSDTSKISYQSYIDALFEITEKTVGSITGLPQGPAYSRYLAELYLDNLDHNLDSKLQQEEIFLYQRYVDDIFIISPSEDAARKILSSLRTELELIGLKINEDKTSITKITHFSNDFNAYRSQSKYAVDRVSKNFEDSTSTQKNLAVNEFIKLVQSDSCNDDLAFIFSHLAGVQILDPLKRDKVEPTLSAKIGRGSLYKHLFNFVLESPENWELLNKSSCFDELQSEVLTACLISAFESSKSALDDLRTLTIALQKKITNTDLTFENLAYLALVFHINLDLSEIPASHIIDCLTSLQETDQLDTSTSVIEKLNTPLNDIKQLPRFIEAIYPLCASINTSPKDLNNLAATFYSKLSSDEQNGKLSVNIIPEINAPSTASKFYYLLCLFSISNKNKSPDLLRSAWKYCAHIFNTHEMEISHRTPDWFKKIGSIEHSQENALLLISTIVDGNIFRGLADKARIFEKFHSLLLIYVTLQDNDMNNANIELALEELKDKADFYKWLIEKKHTTIFPTTNKSWFEKNIIDNSSILLKRENQVLFRKPTDSFHSTSQPTNEHNGYSEIIVDYSPEKLKTLEETVSSKTISQKIKKLLEIITTCKRTDAYPNIFCKDRMLKDDSLVPFCEELLNSRSIIIEDREGNIETLSNNQKNFIQSYFKYTSAGDPQILLIKEKYIENLDDTIDAAIFLRHFFSQLEEIAGSEDIFHLDLAAASALYLSLNDNDFLRRSERFIDQYHRFNQKDSERQIYAVDENSRLADGTPLELLNTIELSVKLIPTTVVPYSTLYLYSDIENYKSNLINMLDREELSPNLDINSFKRIRPVISPISESIHFGEKSYSFFSVQLINLTTHEIHQFETRHSIAISSSEHVYASEKDSVVYIVAMHSFLTKIYNSIANRFSQLSEAAAHFRSYPTTIIDEQKIECLNGFSLAVDVISIHRDVDKIEARRSLTKWLSSLPKKFHQMLVTLISAHTVMFPEEIQSFTNFVETLIKTDDSNPFLIKHIGDYNGTHRVLFKGDKIGRTIESLSPANIKPNSECATIIVDTIITGSQIISALSFYLTGEGSKPNSNYFLISDENSTNLQHTLKNLKSMNICTILYTPTSVRNIESFLRDNCNSAIKINIVHGKNIGNCALFGTTDRIGEQEKEMIRQTLADPELTQELYEHLEDITFFESSKMNLDDQINATNLVARYQSLPKRCFIFLKTGLRHEPHCHPLTRIKELNE